MLHKTPDLRSTIYDVARHPIVAHLGHMLSRSLQVEHSCESMQDPPEVLGAVVAEADSFFHDVYNKAYPSLASPPAPHFSLSQPESTIDFAAPSRPESPNGMDLD